MKHLVIHPNTQQHLQSFIATPAHAALLIGPTGSGKSALAASALENILHLEPGTLTNYPYGLVIAPADGKAIGIDTVRQLNQFLSLKVPVVGEFNRYVILENAHLLTLEAQNAILKILEEPPAGTLIVLTANHEQSLLPTIRSRARIIPISRPVQAELEAHFQPDFDQAVIKRAYSISGGLPGLMQSLLTETDHELSQATDMARQLLSQSAYQRLLMVDELARHKNLAADVTFILQQMAHVSLQTANGAAARKWQRIFKASYQTAEALGNNAQPKLTLTNLMLKL